MGYKLLGYVVWQGAKFYLRRNRTSIAAKAAAVGGAAVVVAAIAVGGRQAVNGKSE